MSVTRSRRVVGSRRNAPTAKPVTSIEGLEPRTLFTTVVVNSVLDTTGTVGTTTLRDAIAIANAATSTPTTITFDPSVFGTAKTITMTGSTAFTLNNGAEPTTIVGPTAGVTLDAGGSSTVMNVTTTATVSVSNVTFTNGAGTQGQAGGIFNQQANLTLTNCTVSNCTTDNWGGGLKNWGNTVLIGDTFRNNTALEGGGVYSSYANVYTISISNCTFANNRATGQSAIAGGVYVSDAPSSITNSTFTNNSAPDGAAIYVGASDLSACTISDCTIDANNGNSAVFNVGAASRCTISNTIVAGSVSADVSGLFNSHGGNLIGAVGSSTGWIASDITGTAASPVDPLLGTLAQNGGQTLTLLPAEGSPALNNGLVANIPNGVTTDQRGDVRTISGTVDIGAVEVAKSLVVTAPPSQTAVPLLAKSFSLGSFTTSGMNGPYAVTVNWGDGSAHDSFSATASGTLSPLMHTYANVGVDTVTVSIVDASGVFTGSASFTVTVAQLPAITVVAPSTQTAVIATSTPINLGSITVTNTAAPYTVTVNWGDNTTPTTFTTSSTGTLPATAHAFATSGADNVTVTVANSDGTVSGTAAFVVTVTTGSTASSVALASSVASPVLGDSVTLTATVTPSTASGVVTFKSNGNVVGQSTVTNGVATLTTTTLPIGADSLTAVYSGDHTYATSTSPVVSVIVLAPPVATTLALASSATAITTSQSVTLTATLAAASGTVNLGIVNFYQGTTLLGTANVSSTGVAILTTTTSLPVGTNVVTATYVGNASFVTSTSTGVAILVTQTTTVTNLALSNPSKTRAQAITLTATIAPATITATTLSNVSPTGTVTFSSAGTVIGTATVGTNGIAVLSTTAAMLPVGIVQIAAAYDGDVSFSNSTSSLRTVSVTEHALVPTIVSVAVPASAIGGVKVRGAQVKVLLANGLTANQAGDETGSYAVTVYASAGTTVAAGDRIVASTIKSNKIRQGKTTTVTVPISELPATLADGTYHLLVVTTDSKGNTEEVDTGKTVAVTAPTVALTAAFASVSRSAVNPAATIALTDTGNADFTTTLTASIGVTTDAAGTAVVAAGASTVRPVKVTLHPGRPTKLKVTGWAPLFAGLPLGTYYLTVTLTDASGHAASAISATVVTKLRL